MIGFLTGNLSLRTETIVFWTAIYFWS